MDGKKANPEHRKKNLAVGKTLGKSGISQGSRIHGSPCSKKTVGKGNRALSGVSSCFPHLLARSFPCWECWKCPWLRLRNSRAPATCPTSGIIHPSPLAELTEPKLQNFVARSQNSSTTSTTWIGMDWRRKW